jgi:hypothetical protein
MSTPPRRRGRMSNAEKAKLAQDAPVAQAAPDAPVTEPPVARRRRHSVGGHAMKLTAPTRPGYTRRFVNDDANRLAELDGLAYDFVTDGSIQSSDPGSRVSRLVGTKKNGEPLRAFLMETPDELYAQGVAEKEAEAQRIDQAISAGETSEGHMAQIPQDERYGKVTVERR